MLSERSGLEKIDRQMKNRPFFVEPKHDGERVQLHKDGDRCGAGSHPGEKGGGCHPGEGRGATPGRDGGVTPGRGAVLKCVDVSLVCIWFCLICGRHDLYFTLLCDLICNPYPYWYGCYIFRPHKT